MGSFSRSRSCCDTCCLPAPPVVPSLSDLEDLDHHLWMHSRQHGRISYRVCEAVWLLPKSAQPNRGRCGRAKISASKSAARVSQRFGVETEGESYSGLGVPKFGCSSKRDVKPWSTPIFWLGRHGLRSKQPLQGLGGGSNAWMLVAGRTIHGQF